MPPPHYSTSASTAHQHASSSQQAQHSGSLTLSDLPKAYRAHVKEVLQTFKAALLAQDGEVSHSACLAALQAIKRLSSNVEANAEKEDEAGSNDAAKSKLNARPFNGATDQAAFHTDQTSARKMISSILTANLSNCFNDEIDQDSHNKKQLFITLLYAMKSCLDPRCIVLEWWDVLLRPMLKNPHCNVKVCRKAQHLVVWAMSSAPSSAYVDEPQPSPIWPQQDPASTTAAQHKSMRKPGDAPYPISSTRSVSASTSSGELAAPLSAIYSTPAMRNGPTDSLKRFAQRVFDLYTSEASSIDTTTAEEDDVRDSEEDEGQSGPSQGLKYSDADRPDPELVAPTWKGNLEAIILSFGDERPKPFFHHLSESFLEAQARIPILLLLTVYLRISSQHAYHIVSASFVRLLVLSLQLDTSKTCISLGVLALVTLIPHFPNWLANGGAGGLPAMLSIYARVVVWRKLDVGWEERIDALLGPEGAKEQETEEVRRIARRLESRVDLEWKRLESNYDNTHAQYPNAQALFTMLYGIFPCNVIRFLRAPIDYLRKAGYQSPFKLDWEDIIDEGVVQKRSAPILQKHLLHPALVELTAEREISDTQRWKEHDAASTAADCVSLYIGQHLRDVDGIEKADDVTYARHDDGVSRLPGLLSLDEKLKDRLEGLVGDGEILSDQHAGRPRSLSQHSGERAIKLQQISHASHPPFLAQIQGLRVHSLEGNSVRQDTSVMSPLQAQEEALQRHAVLNTAASVDDKQRRKENGSLSPSSSTSTGFVRTFAQPQSTLASAMMSPSTSNMSMEAPIDSIAHPRPFEAGSPRLPGPASSPPPFSPSAGVSSNVRKIRMAYLKQENLHLRNELNFEIGQKDQLLSHIGTIHRNRVSNTVMEEELQQVYTTSKNLKMQAKKISEEMEMNKMEAKQSKLRQSNWQADLTQRMKSVKQEKVALSSEMKQLQRAKGDQDELIAKLEGQLNENAGELFELRERERVNASKVQAIRQYEEKIDKLQTCLQMWNDDVKIFDEQRREILRSNGRWQEMQMLIQASSREARVAQQQVTLLQRAKDEAEREMAEAKQMMARLTRDAQKSRKDRLGWTSSSNAAEAEGKEARDNTRMKKRIEDLENLLLDAKVREEQWQWEKQQQQQQRRLTSPAHPFSSNHLHHPDQLTREADIDPLSLGKAARQDAESEMM